MILWTRKRSQGAAALAAALGWQYVNGRGQPAGSVAWGRKSNKLEELATLAAAELPTPVFARDKIEGNVWLGRTVNHTQARDLLRPPRHPDYWVEKVETVREHRVHVFGEEIVRVQMKQADGPESHPWIRSSASGWTLVAKPEYTKLLPKGARQAAKAAVKALEYPWGAVDIGTLPNGKIVVFEVNSAPGLKCEGTLNTYVRHMKERYG